MQIIGNDVEISIVLLGNPLHVYPKLISLNRYEYIILHSTKTVIDNILEIGYS